MGKKFYLLLVLLLALGLLAGCGAKPVEKAGEEKPAATAENKEAKPAEEAQKPVEEKKEPMVIALTGAKNGCSDCHAPGKKVKLPDGKEKDVSLAGESKLIPNHPEVADKATLKDCFVCHKMSPEKRDKFVTKLHDVHMNSKIFTGQYKQTCSGCHDMKNIKL